MQEPRDIMLACVPGKNNRKQYLNSQRLIKQNFKIDKSPHKKADSEYYIQFNGTGIHLK